MSEFADSASDVLLKFVVQAIPQDPETEGGPLKYRAKFRPEIEFSDFQDGVPEGWDGPTGKNIFKGCDITVYIISTYHICMK